MRILLRGTSAMVLAFLAFGCEIAASPDRDRITEDAGPQGSPDAADVWQPESGQPEASAEAGPDAGEASVASCTNNIMDGEETAVDCGGKCPTRCDDGAACKVGDDCKNGVCKGAQCKAPSCNDQVKNGTETDLDCGGSCIAKCGPLKGCATPSDCLDGVCTNGKCAAAGCTDEMQNGKETDVDCGGGECETCADTLKCAADSDCLSGFCDPAAKVCSPADCGNGHEDSNETDVDCGGSCTVKCAVGKGCASGTDCTEKVCDTNANPPVCVAGTCTDQVLNGGETDVDCGGSCKKCSDGLGCKAAADCTSAHCADQGGTSKCVAPTCTDGIANQDESDVDCGGQTGCGRCPDGLKCSLVGDCVTGHQCDPATMTCVECTATEHCLAANAVPACIAGVCAGACNAGFGDCNGNKQTDGCETPLQTSTAHCGTCGNACPAGFVCDAGSCVCDTDDDCTNGGTCNNQSRCRCGNTTCAPGELCTSANTCGK